VTETPLAIASSIAVDSRGKFFDNKRSENRAENFERDAGKSSNISGLERIRVYVIKFELSSTFALTDPTIRSRRKFRGDTFHSAVQFLENPISRRSQHT